MKLALRAEWTKLRTVWSTLWLLLGIVALTVAIDVISVAATRSGDPGRVSLIGVDFGQAVAAVLAVLCVSNEYSSGMIRVSLLAMPRRPVVLAAKVVLVFLLVLAAGAVAAGASWLAALIVLPGHGFGWASLDGGPMLRAAVGSALYLALVALLALGLAVVVRDGAVSIGAVLGLLYLFPLLASALGPHWRRLVQQISPMLSGLDVQVTVGVRTLPLTPWEGLGVLAAWALGALAIGGLIFARRDVLLRVTHTKS
jgi:ABC-2 type transport system permease protein